MSNLDDSTREGQALHDNAVRGQSVSSVSSVSSSKSIAPISSSAIAWQDESANTSEAQGLQREKANKGKAQESLRRSQACLACRKRKLRCDAKKPTCSRCEIAWSSYDSQGDLVNRATTAPPPCEYDASLFSKIFKRPSSPDSPSIASGPSVDKPITSSSRSERASITQNSLQADNDRLRARISLLEADLTLSRDSGADSPVTGSREDDRLTQRSLSLLRDQDWHSTSPRKRKPSMRSNVGGNFRPESRRSSEFSSVGPIHDSSENRNPSRAASSQLIASSSDSARAGTAGSTPSSVLPPKSRTQWEKRIYPPADQVRSSIELQPTPPPPPLPPSELLLEIVHAFTRSSWLAFAFNAYALSDLIIILDSSTPPEVERCIAEAVLMALIAVSLPFSPPAVAPLADLLGKESFPIAAIFSSIGPIPMITNAYASGARDLLHYVRENRGQYDNHDTLPAQLLLVEYSSGNSTTRESQAELAQAIVEARLLDLHDIVSGVSPKLELQSTRNTELGRALDGLMQVTHQNHAFWYLYIQDCIQSKLAGSPCLIDRDSIRTVFPGRLGPRTLQSIQNAQAEVLAHLQNTADLPQLELHDDAYCLLIKATMVLSNCCDFAVRGLSKEALGTSQTLSDLRQGRDINFQALNEKMRLLRLALSQFNDRNPSTSITTEQDSGRHYLETYGSLEVLFNEDLLRFAADTTHHLCVLSLYGSQIDAGEPFENVEARDVVTTAATWLSRLAKTSLRPGSQLSISLAPACSVAFFIAARWFLYLQIASPSEFQLDISTLAAALWTRANNCANDYLLAKAIVALARERDSFGRICISPFSWPIDAISKFVPMPRTFGSRARAEWTGEPALSTSILALTYTVEDAAVEKLVMHS